MVDLRLGQVDYALSSGDRFLNISLVNRIEDSSNFKTTGVLFTEGIAINPAENKRIPKTQVLGVDEKFWRFSRSGIENLSADEVYISENLAGALNVAEADFILVRVKKISVIPVNAPFVSEENSSVALRLRIKKVLSQEDLSRFSLKSNQTAPYNIFVSRESLSEKLSLENMCNLILADADVDRGNNPDDLNHLFSSLFSFEDTGLEIDFAEGSYFKITSSRIFIDPSFSNKINSLYPDNLKILTYLVNSFEHNDKSAPYSFAAATDFELRVKPAKEEVVVNQWLADDLSLITGDSLIMSYYVIGPLKKLQTQNINLKVVDIIPIQTDMVDASLMPPFPGLADAGSCSEWDTGIPIDLHKIRDRDEKYWDDFGGTPKALINYELGKQIWSNRYGNQTAIWIDKDQSFEELKQKLNLNIKPEDIGLSFLPVRQEGRRAASNGVDFGELFMGLSFFVIAAGILLITLIAGLNIEERTEETGILSGLGFTMKQINRLLFYEFSLVVLLGSLAGAALGIAYNHAILWALNSIWREIVRTEMLQLYILPKSLIIGGLSGFLIGIAVIFYTTRKKLKKSIVNLIRGNIFSDAEEKPDHPGKGKRKTWIVLIIAILSFLFLLIYALMHSIEQFALLLLGAGAILIAALVALFSLWLRKTEEKGKRNMYSFFGLTLKNLSRNRGRSIATVALLGIGVFGVIVTGANRKTFYGADSSNSSGTGGFLFWMETTIPILNDLNTAEGKEKYGLSDVPELSDATFVHFYELEGDDASCLNLNQVSKPAVLGVDPAVMERRKSFSFAQLAGFADKEQPWLTLGKDGENEDVIYAFADQTVLTWGLMKQVGDTLTYLNEAGEEVNILLAGGLKSSVFQGNIIISENDFLENFPSSGGAEVLLVDGEKDKKEEIKDALYRYLVDYGVQISGTEKRLAEFYSVTNTYLTVFMVLGGLGLIIGTIGMGILLLRNIHERRNEIGILRAVGFKKQKIFQLLFIENILLLITGIVMGTVASIIGILPSIVSKSFELPYLFLTGILISIVVAGVIWIYIPAKKSTKNNLIDALRNE